MRNYLYITFLELSRIFERISKMFNKGSKQDYWLEWNKCKGDKTLRLNYDLNQNSIVFDLGGYEGQWASDIFSKYCCTIHVFEPVSSFADNIEKRFLKNNKIILHKCGLSNKTKICKICIDKDGSSIFKTGNAMEDISLIKANDFLKNNGIDKIDLMKINIEGAEYGLLEHLIETGIIKKIKDVQIQFHRIIPDADLRKEKISDKLQKTHYLTYQYPFIWENWKMK